MSTVEIKKELHQIIDNSDPTILENFYQMVKGFLKDTENSRLILESEIDIQEGNIHSLEEVKKAIESWKE
jgi:hypothetical protein